VSRPNILYLTHRVPFPPNRGDRIRTWNILRHLAARSRVWLGCLADEPVADSTWRVLHEVCHRVVIISVEKRLRWLRAGFSMLRGRTISEGAFSNPRLHDFVRAWAGQTGFDAALCSSSALAPYLLVPELEGVRRSVDLIDVDSEKWFDYSKASSGFKRSLYRLEGRRMRRLESSIADWAESITVVSEPEANLYRGFCPTGPVHALPNGVDLDFFTPRTDRANESGCVFVGALDYRPNIEGIVWFCRNVWPEIHRQRPDQRLRIVGREPVEEVRQLANVPGVDVIGTVPDVRPWLNQAAVAVVPLQIARGVQNKVLEAFAMARAVVASPEPLVGLNVIDGVHACCARQPEDWVRQVVQLLDQPERRADMGLAGQALVTADYRWEQCLSPLMNLLGLPSETAFANPSSSEYEPRQWPGGVTS